MRRIASVARILLGLWMLLGLSVGLLEAKEREPIVLRVQWLPSPTSTTPQDVALQRMVAAFRKDFPHIVLETATGLNIETMTPEATTMMMVAGGIAPDVLKLNFRSLDSFLGQGMLAPLGEFMNGEKEEILRQIPEQILPVVSRRADHDGREFYGLPTQLVVTGLWFNREIFRMAGLPQRAPRDWKELIEFARKIRDLDKGYNPIFLNSGPSASWNLMTFLWSAGGEAVEEIEPGEWRAVFDSPGAIDAYLFYYRLVEIERLAIRGPVLPTGFSLEKVGMFFGYVGDSSNRDAEVWGFGAVPAGPEGVRGAEINSPILAMYSGIKDPEVRQAAWEFIRFMNSHRADQIRVNTLIELGQASQLNPVVLRRFGYEQYLALTPKGLEEEYLEAMRTGKPEPYGKNCNLIYNEMTYPLDQILLADSIRRHWDAGEMELVRKEAGAILTQAVARTNERMIGYVSPEQMKVRRTVASLVVLAIAVNGIWVLRYVSRIFSNASSMMTRPVNSRSLLPWLCLLPALTLLVMWGYVPLLRGTVLAFLDHKVILKSSFVGLDNFANVLFDRTFWDSLFATAYFAAWMLSVGFMLPILLAYALHLIPKYKILYRIIYYLPAAISASAVFFLWRELFGLNGLLNECLRFFGFEMPRAWPEDPRFAMLSCVIPGIWAGAGPGCLIYLAALKTIPEEQFEASEIDGAGFWDKTRLIIYPALRSLIAINFVGAVAASFHGATNILIMTGGGPNGMTEVTSLKIFYEAFIRLRFGPATAMAWVLGSMLVGFTVIQLKRLSQMEFKTAR